VALDRSASGWPAAAALADKPTPPTGTATCFSPDVVGSELLCRPTTDTLSASNPGDTEDKCVSVNGTPAPGPGQSPPPDTGVNGSRLSNDRSTSASRVTTARRQRVIH